MQRLYEEALCQIESKAQEEATKEASKAQDDYINEAEVSLQYFYMIWLCICLLPFRICLLLIYSRPRQGNYNSNMFVSFVAIVRLPFFIKFFSIFECNIVNGVIVGKIQHVVILKKKKKQE